jgi:hypothetical protein
VVIRATISGNQSGNSATLSGNQSDTQLQSAAIRGKQWQSERHSVVIRATISGNQSGNPRQSVAITSDPSEGGSPSSSSTSLKLERCV